MHLATLIDFAGTIALLALLAVPYGVARDRMLSATRSDVLLGFLFGLTAAAAMLDPLVLADGIVFDMRNLPVGLAGAFLGPLGAAVAIVPAAAMRIVIGGDGVGPALCSLAIAGGAGVLWRMLDGRFVLGRLMGPLLLGALISLHLLPVLMLPRETMALALGAVVPFILGLNVCGTLIVASLISREQRNLDRRRRLDLETVTDPLTGIANRRGFERGTRRGRRAGRLGNAVLLIDIDHFKAINDRLGHAAGDAVLREMGSRLKTLLREEDIVARFGGEEFCVYLSDASRRDTQVVSERLRRGIAERPFRVGGESLAVTISVGVHWQRERVADWDRILVSTDQALYAAKAQGRDRVVFVDSEPLRAAA